MAAKHLDRIGGAFGAAKPPKPVVSDLDDRFARAEQVMEGRSKGLLEEEPAALAQRPRLVEGRVVISVPVAALKDNPFNARKVYQDEVIRKRAESIKQNGQYVPVKAVEDWTAPGHYILIDGHYRKRACIHIGKDTVDVDLQEGVRSNRDLYRISRIINVERSEQNILDDALAWQQLLTMKECASAQEIAELDGISKATVSKTLQILELPQPVLSVIEANPSAFGIRSCYELCLIAKHNPESEVLEGLARRISSGELTTKQLEEIRAKMEQGVSRKRKETPNHYVLKHHGVEIGGIKVWPSGRVSCDFTETDEAKRNELLSKLKSVLEF